MNIPEINGPNGEVFSNFTFFKKGGMGEIYKCTEKHSKQEFILKLILVDDPSEKELLKREIAVSTQFSNANIVTSKITGEIKINGHSYLYMILDYFKHGNMRSLISPNTPIQECYRMMLDILNGMKEVHNHIVHRDLKPENILVGDHGELLLTDFGLAKYINEKTKTKSFKGAGTIPYMAPECWTGDENTISMDIYSLGLIFFEIITGEWAFKANTEMEWRNCHLFTSIPDISSLRSDVNIKTKQIIQKMTNKRVSERYSSIGEIIKSLNDAIQLGSTEKKDADRLALMGSMVIQQKKTKALEDAKKQEKIDELKSSLKFNIEELFSKFTDKANAINDRLEEEKVVIDKNIIGNDTSNMMLGLHFNGKGITINFASYDAVISKPQQGFFIKNDIVLIGLAETTYKIGNIEYGFNLLLKKKPDSHYGDWYIMQFSKNITPPETSFAIDLNSYFKEYDTFRMHPMYTVKFQQLTDQDITSLLEKTMF